MGINRVITSYVLLYITKLNNYSMGRTGIWIYICIWNGLIVKQDLCYYYMNNVRRNFTMGLNICYMSIYHLSVYLAFNIIIYLVIYLLIYTSFIALKLWLHNVILSQFKSKVDLRHTIASIFLSVCRTILCIYNSSKSNSLNSR